MDIGETIADANLKEEGVWLRYQEDSEFLIASTQRKVYRDKLGKISWRARRVNRNRDLAPSEADAVTTDAMIDTILLDWKGLQYSKKHPDAPGYSDEKVGQNFPYNPVNAKWYLVKAPDVRDWIYQEAGNLNNFQQENPEEQADDPLAATKSGSTVPAGTG